MHLGLEEGESLTVRTPRGVIVMNWYEEDLRVGISPDSGAIAEITAHNLRTNFSPDTPLTIVRLTNVNNEQHS